MARRISDATWMIFFVLGVLSVITALRLWSGRPPDPPSPEGTTGLSLADMNARIPGLSVFIASVTRQLGNFMFVSGILMAAVAAFPFRKGERWAWYSLWSVPVLLLLQFFNSNFGNGWWADLGLAPVTIAALVAPYRKFFPGRRRGA
jgi:hypothetical protein